MYIYNINLCQDHSSKHALKNDSNIEYSGSPQNQKVQKLNMVFNLLINVGSSRVWHPKNVKDLGPIMIHNFLNVFVL